MIEEGELLKQVVERQAFVYKVLKVNPSGLEIAKLCTIANGKMEIDYGKRIKSNIFMSDIGTYYKIIKVEEMSKILEILHKAMVEFGF